MIELRSADRSNIDQVYSLINAAFREPNNFPHNMHEFFPYLFKDENLKNIRIIADNGTVLSVLCSIFLDVDIEGCVLKVTSIGSVCTRKGHEGKGYASLLLQDCRNRAKASGADLLLLIGHRELYTRNGIYTTGTAYRFELNSEDIDRLAGDRRISVVECPEEDYGRLYDIYNTEKVRYIRSDREVFTALAKAAAWPRCAHAEAVVRAYELKENGNTTAYVIIADMPKGGWVDKPFAVEYAGSRTAIADALGTICKLSGITVLTSYVSAYDVEMLETLKRRGIVYALKSYPGRLGIANFEQMTGKLRPLFDKRGIPEGMSFSGPDGKFVISEGHRNLIIADDKLMLDILFGSTEGKQALDGKTEGSFELLDMMMKALPVPLVYPLNLNLI